MSDPISDVIRADLTGLVRKAETSLNDCKTRWDRVLCLLSLVGPTVETLVRAVERLDGLRGTQKKAIALTAIEEFCMTVVAPLELLGVPNWSEPRIDTAGAAILRSAAGWMIDAAVDRLNTEGWGDD